MSTSQVISSDVVYQTPTERWKDKSKHSNRDNIIKAIALSILGTMGVIGVFALAFLPFILVEPTPAILLAYVTGNGILIGGGLSNIHFIDFFDWRNYSNKEEVRKNCIDLTTQSLEDLRLNNNSPIYRIDNLKKYGIISEEIANKIKIIYEKYETSLENIDSIKSNYPNLNLNQSNVNRFTEQVIHSYQNAIEGQEQLAAEWKHLQENILADLPSLE